MILHGGANAVKQIGPLSNSCMRTANRNIGKLEMKLNLCFPQDHTLFGDYRLVRYFIIFYIESVKSETI